MSTIAAAAPRKTRRFRGPIGWYRDPWRKPRVLAAATWLYLVWSLVPVGIAIMFSFNNGRSRSSWQGFSTMWYVGHDLPGGAYSLLTSPTLKLALAQTMKLAIITTLVAVPLGFTFALGIDRWHGRPASVANFGMLFSFVMPELIIGVALFFVFAMVLKNVPSGTWQQSMGLICFQMSYPVIVIRARLLSIGRQYEEAGMDLGATATQSVRRVLLPMLWPAIFASAVLVFADCIDDFVIVAQLRGPATTDTISVKLYSGYRSAPTPAYNAMATLMLVVTLTAMFIGVLAFSRIAKKRGADRSQAMESFALEM